METIRLLLAYPEIESSNTNTSTYSLPLGLGSIATACKQRFGNSLDVKILDGSIITHDNQLEEIRKFKPDITGIAPTIASQHKGYELGRLAKNLSSLVFYGGVNSTNLWKNMLTNRDFIDGVILYDGEEPMIQILENKEFDSIPNLAFRDSRGVYAPAKIYIPKLNDLPDIDYSLFDMKLFLEQTQKRGFGKAVTYYSGKGCSKRGGMQKSQTYSYEDYIQLIKNMNICSFCGRNELGFRSFAEEREDRILKYLNEEYGINGFFNVQDTVNLGYTRPLEIDAWFRLFLGLETVNKKNIAKLKQRYGSKLIFQVGIESADANMRVAYGKSSTNEKDIFDKVRLMSNEGIELHASFILGGKGETKDSMKRTRDTIEKIADYDNVSWILISPQLILPGSPDYRNLLQEDGMSEKYSEQDLIDIVEINKDFLRYYSELTREDIIKEIKSIFEVIETINNRIVRDVKGVIATEEEFINPYHPYAV